MSKSYSTVFEQLEALDQYVSQSKKLNLLYFLLRSASMYGVYFLMILLCLPSFESGYAYHCAPGMPILPDLMLHLIILLLPFLMLRSVILTFSIYNKREREAFIKADGETFDEKSEKQALLRSPWLWGEVAALCFFFLLHPVSYYHNGLLLLIPYGTSLAPILQKMIAFVPFAGAVVHFSLSARIDARKYWIVKQRELYGSKLWQGADEKKKRTYRFYRMLFRIGGHLAAFFLFGLFGAYSVAVCINLVKLVFLLANAVGPLLFVGLLVFLFSWNYIRALIKRISFIKRLKKACRQWGFRLFDLRHPYLSVFKSAKNYSFGVDIGQGKRFYCRMLAGVRRQNELHLYDDGIFRKAFPFRIYLMTASVTGLYINYAYSKTTNYIEILRFHSKARHFTFFAPEDGEKLLILNPVPLHVFRVCEDSHSETFHELDNGMEIGDCRIYTGGSFLRMLDRMVQKD